MKGNIEILKHTKEALKQYCDKRSIIYTGSETHEELCELINNN